VSAKKLLMDDTDYSTPSDHYFSYINHKDDRPDKIELLRSLKMDGSITQRQMEKILEKLDEKVEYSLFTGREYGKPKYEKEDYEQITELGMKGILIATAGESKKV